MLALADDAGLRLLDFLDRPEITRKAATLGQSLGRVVVHGDHPTLDAVADGLDAYFAGRRLTFDVPLAPVGSPWQLRVWEALRTIPPGETRSYAQLAETLGRPTAGRAPRPRQRPEFAGDRHPLPPGHPPDGSLSGYAGGPWRKQWLLDHERAHLGRAGEARAPSA